MGSETLNKNSSNQQDWPLTDSVVLRIIDGLYRCRKHIWTNDQNIVNAYGLTWSQLMVLEALRNNEPEFILTPGALATLTQSTSGGITKMLTHLAELDMIERVINAKDKRSSLVRLTPIGAETVEHAMHDLVNANTNLLMETLTLNESETLAELLHKLRRGLQKSLSGTV